MTDLPALPGHRRPRGGQLHDASTHRAGRDRAPCRSPACRAGRRAHPRRCCASTARTLTQVLALHALAALAALAAPAAGRRPRRRGAATGTTRSHVDTPGDPGSPSRSSLQTVADVGRAPGLVHPGRDGVRPAARAVHRRVTCAAAVDRRARRHRRPASPAPPTTSRRSRTSCASASRRCSSPWSPPRSPWSRPSLTGAAGGAADLLGVPSSGVSTRRYLRLAPGRLPARAGDLRRRSTASSPRRSTAPARSTRSASAAAGVAAGRRGDRASCYEAESYTLRLRAVWFPTGRVRLPRCRSPAPCCGAAGWSRPGTPSLGTVTAVALYVQQMAGPLDELLIWLDEIQVGATSLARVIGVGRRARRPRRRPARRPATSDVAVERRALRLPRRAATCCTASTSTCAPGERLAIVGPSGAGKSTLGRLLAGIHGPRTGRVDVGGVRAGRPAAGRAARRRSRWSPRSTTCSSARCADNLLLARPAAPTRRRAAVGAAARSTRSAGPPSCPTASTPVVGCGGHALTPAQAQQLALARLVLADPHTLVLDEATSLLDPRAARHLERSLAAVLRGPHGRGDRAPAAHRPRRRPGRRGRGRPDQRDRHPRRADRRRRRLRRAVALVAGRAGRVALLGGSGSAGLRHPVEPLVGRPLGGPPVRLARGRPQRHRPLGLRGDGQRRVDAEVGRHGRAVDDVQARIAPAPGGRGRRRRARASRRSRSRRGSAPSSGRRATSPIDAAGRRPARPVRSQPRRQPPHRLVCPAGIQVGFGSPWPCRDVSVTPAEQAAAAPTR